MPRRRVRGSGSVYFDDARGRWVGQAPLPPGPGGKRRRVTVYGTTATEAQAKLDSARRQQQPRGSAQTLRQYLTWYCDEYLVGRADRGEINRRTVVSYRQNLLGHVAPAIGHVRLDKVRPEHLTALLTHLSKSGLSSSTQRLVYGHLRNALTVAERFELVEKNWAKVMPAPKRGRVRQPVPTVEQSSALLAAAEHHRSRALFTIMLTLGLRVGEATGLTWADIDLDTATMTVRRQLVRSDGRWILEPLKWRDDDEERRIQLPDFAVAALREHRRDQLAARMRFGSWWRVVDGLDDLVFRMELGEPVWPDQVRRDLTKLCEAAGIPRFTPHSLRRAAATFLVARGVPLSAVMEVLGWKTARIALEVYAQAQRDTLGAAAAAMDELFGSQSSK